jgi:CubicO group peptidase (beta-lactamase class C family)
VNPDATITGADLSPSARSSAEQMLRAQKVPGAVLARVSAAGLEATAAFGWSNLAPQRATSRQTAFHLYSGTKLFTASAVMLLAERGVLDIDADVRGLLPELPLRHPVTARQLLSHSSGLRDSLRAFLAIHLPDERAPTTAEALSRYSLARSRMPDTKARYRNVDYAILGELVSRLSGIRYEDMVRTELLEPWGSRASFRSSDFVDLATGCLRRWDPMRFVVRYLVQRRPSDLFAGVVDGYSTLRRFDLDNAAIGGLVGCAADFAPLVAEFLGDRDGVLRAETRRHMLTLTSNGAAGVASTVGVGLGWKCGAAGDLRFWNHEGGGPGFCSELRIYPSLGVGFIVLTNLSQSRRLSRAIHVLCEQLRPAGPRAG